MADQILRHHRYLSLSGLLPLISSPNSLQLIILHHFFPPPFTNPPFIGQPLTNAIRLTNSTSVGWDFCRGDAVPTSGYPSPAVSLLHCPPDLLKVGSKMLGHCLTRLLGQLVQAVSSFSCAASLAPEPDSPHPAPWFSVHAMVLALTPLNVDRLLCL